jgi:hypothetical protein
MPLLQMSPYNATCYWTDTATPCPEPPTSWAGPPDLPSKDHHSPVKHAMWTQVSPFAIEMPEWAVAMTLQRFQAQS